MPPALPPPVPLGSESPTSETNTSGAFAASLVMINRPDFGPRTVGRKVTSISVDVDGERLLMPGLLAVNAASP